ncbi:helix-turn-helix protein [Amycolatopsis echigonensis]|uniref:Helix-turn-helix protein n=1 Tax=Amycolatopsis echigonensis TaxID=2576905 RepID=A0A2N3WPZ0_9PSEU|nr:helix-turn-helix transcriptional regulator [Amycolatopsis niigatensis]PKV95938.1 helix-turn-helix protein [Amycolatopsis niigatensis]
MTSPTERRLALGDQLRLLRDTAGISGKHLAEQLGWPASKISRIERARQAVTDTDLVAMSAALGLGADEAEQLRNELRAIRIEEARWSQHLRVGHRALQEQVGQEQRDAQHIAVFALTMVPGLVQTAEYARHVFLSLAEVHDTPRDTEAAVGARMERQQLLYAEGKTIELLLTTFAFTNPIAPASVMRAQIDRLIALQGLPTLRLGIIPPGVALPAAVAHTFRIADDTVSVELVNTEVSTRDPGDLALYTNYLAKLWDLAAEGDEARALLMRLARDLT